MVLDQKKFLNKNASFPIAELLSKKTTKKSQEKRSKFREDVENEQTVEKAQEKTIKSLNNSTAKPVTNLQQTCNKPTSQPVTQSVTNLQQTCNKPTSKPVTNLQQICNKPTSQPVTQSVTNLQQTCNKPTTKTVFLSLTGQQAQAIKTIYSLCRAKGKLISDPITSSQFANALKTTVRSLQTTINRLIEKRMLVRSSYKNGRGGWTKYKIPQEVYQELFNLETCNKPVTNLQQTCNKSTPKPTSQPVTSHPSSSSDLYITTTTAKDEKNG